MADETRKCPCCNGRGYFRCECWPADCICGRDDRDCDECGGEGWIDPSYDALDIEIGGTGGASGGGTGC